MRTTACTAWCWVSPWVSRTVPSRPPSAWGLHNEPRPARGARRARAGRRTGRLGDLRCPRGRVPEGGFRGEASVAGEGGYVAEGDDERSVPALPRREHLTHEPPLRLQDAVAPPGQQRNPTMRLARTFSGILFDAVAIGAILFIRTHVSSRPR